jgi:hypothetical protein
MNSTVTKALLIGGALLALGACMKNQPNDANATANNASATTEMATSSDPTASAQSAAPSAISADAAVIQVAADGTMTELRKGTNGWTCMPDNPQTPGKDPMCMDANALKWAQAWMAHKPPPANNVGLMYMLQGGSDASNIDPFGDKPTNGKWVDTGPHVMVVGAESLNKLYPATADPDTTKPYVMFGGTPYAHMMIPIK